MTRPPVIRLYEDEACADLFAGGGGTSTGIEMVLGRSPDVAINHDATALAMHEANHPTTRHLREDVYDVDPAQAMKGKRCAFAWFSPDCTFHSKARGGKPFRDRARARRIRGLAWVAVRWAESPARPTVIFLENVEEFQEWGPIGEDGRPDPEKKGKSFARWVARLRNHGYAVEWRQLRACDFGAPTTRKRLFVIARCDGKPIAWPEPTHGPRRPVPYRTAAECIDFSLAVPSIFLTPAQAKQWAAARGVDAPRRPLAPATLRRIARGIRRYVIEAPEPFIVTDPRLAPAGIQSSLVAAFLAKHNGGHEATGQRVEKPIDTITTADQKALVTSHLMKLYGTAKDGASLADPMPTVTATGNHIAEVRAFLVKYYGTKKDGRPVDAPLDTITTKERYGLVTVTIAGEQYAIVDIGMRMLTPRELFKAQGFPPEYEIDRVTLATPLGIPMPTRLTKRAQTKLCGNSVPPHLAAAVIRANLAERLDVGRM